MSCFPTTIVGSNYTAGSDFPQNIFKRRKETQHPTAKMNSNYAAILTSGNANKKKATLPFPNVADMPSDEVFTPKVNEVMKALRATHSTPPLDELTKLFPGISKRDFSNRWRYYLSDWTDADDEKLRYAMKTFDSHWQSVVTYMGNRTYDACHNRWQRLQKRERDRKAISATFHPTSSAPTSCGQDRKEDAWERKRNLTGEKPRAFQITREQISEVWHLRHTEAAYKLGVSESTLTVVCRRMKLPRWGYVEGRRDSRKNRRVIKNDVPHLETPVNSVDEQEMIVGNLWTTPPPQKTETAEGVAATSTEKGDEDRPSHLGPESAGLAVCCEQASKKRKQDNLTIAIENDISAFYYDQLMDQPW